MSGKAWCWCDRKGYIWRIPASRRQPCRSPEINQNSWTTPNEDLNNSLRSVLTITFWKHKQLTADCSLDLISSTRTRCLTSGNIGSCSANTLTTIIPSCDLARATLKNRVLPRLQNRTKTGISQTLKTRQFIVGRFWRTIIKLSSLSNTSHQTATACDRSNSVRPERSPTARCPPTGCPFLHRSNTKQRYSFTLYDAENRDETDALTLNPMTKWNIRMENVVTRASQPSSSNSEENNEDRLKLVNSRTRTIFKLLLSLLRPSVWHTLLSVVYLPKKKTTIIINCMTHCSHYESRSAWA